MMNLNDEQSVNLQCSDCNKDWHVKLNFHGRRCKPQVCPQCYNQNHKKPNEEDSDYTAIFKYGKCVEGPATEDYSISQLRLVNMHFYHVVDGKKRRTPHPQSHMMHETQVATFLEATLDLHHRPCFHKDGTKREAAPLWEFMVHKVHTTTASYWWCVPGLLDNNHPEGARINQVDFGTRMWAHEDLQREEKEYEEMESRLD